KGRAVAFAGSAAHSLRPLARPQPVEHAAADIGEVIVVVGMPERALGKDEARRRALRRRRFQDHIQSGHSRPLPCGFARSEGYSRPGGVYIFTSREGRRAAMMKWRIGEVMVTKIVELEVTGGSQFILPQATREAVLPISWLQPDFADELGRLK